MISNIVIYSQALGLFLETILHTTQEQYQDHDHKHAYKYQYENGH